MNSPRHCPHISRPWRGADCACARASTGGGGGETGTSLDTRSLRLTGRARTSGPGRGRGRSPAARGAIERGRRTRVLDTPGSGILSARSAP